MTPGSLAERIGLQPGDRLLAIDGHHSARRYRLPVLRGGGALSPRLSARRAHPEETDAASRPGEELGAEFESAVFDRIRTCNNDCFFCFLKGLPQGLRPSLYLKDDDYRLSFSHGNFVTLTNLTTADWRRLEEQRLSPLNVSVHATEPELTPSCFWATRARPTSWRNCDGWPSWASASTPRMCSAPA